jgi:hypothetical protein
MLVVPPKLDEAGFETQRQAVQAILLAGADDV